MNLSLKNPMCDCDNCEHKEAVTIMNRVIRQLVHQLGGKAIVSHYVDPTEPRELIVTTPTATQEELDFVLLP